MREFGLICLTGLIGGAVCGFLIVILGYFEVPELGGVDFLVRQPFEALRVSIVLSFPAGGMFGLVAFPACYYAFLKAVPLRKSIAVTIPATIIVGALGEYVLY